MASSLHERPNANRMVVVFKSIVVGTDGSSTAAEAVRRAADLAGAVGAQVHLVSAYEAGPPGGGQAEGSSGAQEPPKEVEDQLAQAAEKIEQQGVSVERHARQGPPSDALIAVAEEQSADLIVVGNKGMTDAKRFLLGSVPDRVSHHAPCGVMIVRTT